MGRLGGFRYREVTKRLKKLGFEFDRQAAGSHEIWYNPATKAYTTIPTERIGHPLCLPLFTPAQAPGHALSLSRHRHGANLLEAPGHPHCLHKLRDTHIAWDTHIPRSSGTPTLLEPPLRRHSWRNSGSGIPGTPTLLARRCSWPPAMPGSDGTRRSPLGHPLFAPTFCDTKSHARLSRS
jgi:predicted RNA binding protein YcfA (HicA-like mRNA interferase family)